MTGKKALEKLNAYHDKNNSTVIVAWMDKYTSGTLVLTPDQAVSIGSVGAMALKTVTEMER